MFSVVHSGNVQSRLFHFTDSHFQALIVMTIPLSLPGFPFHVEISLKLLFTAMEKPQARVGGIQKKSVQFPDGWFEICLALNE